MLSLLFVLGFMAAGLQAAATAPVMAHFTTCAQLSSSLYPTDTTTWFDASRNPQIVFYAHMLFPLKPGQDVLPPATAPEAWHPPMVWRPAEAVTLEIDDEHYAEAEWLDPAGAVVAHFGLTMPARVSTDYLRLQGRQYIPHTFAMTVGTKDIRAEAGQKALPAQTGQYHIRFYVNGNIEGIAFFRMIGGAAKAEADGAPGSPPAARAVTATSGDGGLNALRDIFKALTKTGQ